MLSYIAFSLLLMLSIARSAVDIETMCNNDYRNMNNTQISLTKLCSSNTCIEKCCSEGEMFNPKGNCINTIQMFQRLKKVAKLISDVDYSKIVLFSWDGSVKKQSKKDFVFIKNERNINCTSEQFMKNLFFILEDGSIRMQETGESNSWSVIKSLEYCLDFKLLVIDRTPLVKLVVREYNAAPADEDMTSSFVLVGLLISSFFLVLVLVVYFLLPQLQNLIGLVLMAYTSSMLVTFLVKIVLQLTNESLTKERCKIISPMMYFASISSFFWLNVMSYDVWWSLRGHRKRCVYINRRGERVKFMWYCLYAWGIPLLITAIVTTLDNIDLSNLHITKPPFDDCFVSAIGVRYYFIIPIGVIIFVNIILFSLTVYNIWMIKSAINRCQDSKSSLQDTNRFATYIKLSVLMGVSWFLELIPPDTTLWVFILTTAYNLLIGVAIFFLFVFNRRIYLKLRKRFITYIKLSVLMGVGWCLELIPPNKELVPFILINVINLFIGVAIFFSFVFSKRIFLDLCQRFNIKNDFTKSFELSSQGTRSGSTRTARVSTKDQARF